MKTIQKSWLTLLFLAVMSFLFSACDGSTVVNNVDDPEEYPEGVVILHVRNNDNGRTAIPLYLEDGRSAGYVLIGSDNNFELGCHYADHLWISDAGPKKITSVKTIPTTGWAYEVAVIPQHTYVVRIETDGKKSYYKLYVMDYILSSAEEGGIIGADIQYCPWNPEELN